MAGAGWVGVLGPRAVAGTDQAAPAKLALRRSAFLPLVGQTFQIARGRSSRNVVLRQVGDLKPTVRPGAEDQFSLIFTNAGHRPVLLQGTYLIRHTRRSQVSLFLVPVGERETVQRYQAIIDSRPLKTFRK